MSPPDLVLEMGIWARGKTPAGVDEAGRGPLAGPVVAAAVILPERFDIPGLDDSKKLTHRQRVAILEQIISSALAFAEASALTVSARSCAAMPVVLL